MDDSQDEDDRGCKDATVGLEYVQTGTGGCEDNKGKRQRGNLIGVQNSQTGMGTENDMGGGGI